MGFDREYYDRISSIERQIGVNLPNLKQFSNLYLDEIEWSLLMSFPDEWPKEAIRNRLIKYYRLLKHFFPVQPRLIWWPWPSKASTSKILLEYDITNNFNSSNPDIGYRIRDEMQVFRALINEPIYNISHIMILVSEKILEQSYNQALDLAGGIPEKYNNKTIVFVYSIHTYLQMLLSQSICLNKNMVLMLTNPENIKIVRLSPSDRIILDPEEYIFLPI